MKVYQTNEIRNIALIGGAKSGKTTLAEAMAFEGGVVSRRGSIDDKNTISDYREIELDRKNSVVASLIYAEINDRKINLIDCPGMADYAGEMISALNVVEAAVMVVNAQVGVEVGTDITWRYTHRGSVPTVFVMNQLEGEKANFEETLKQLQDNYSEKVTVCQYPISVGAGFDAVIDLVLHKMLKFPKGGGKFEVLDIPESEKERAEKYYRLLVEASAAGADDLMEKYFETEDLTLEEMRRGIKLGLASRSIFPVMCCSAKESQGVTRLLEFLGNNVLPPNEGKGRNTVDGKHINVNAAEPFSAFVFKTSHEQHLGEMSYLKVITGEVAEGQDVINSVNSSKERISQLFSIAGKNRVKIDKAVAGDIVATIKLKDVKTNHTLTSLKNTDIVYETIGFPDPIYTTAIKAVNSQDDEKLGVALNEMHATDPTLIVEYSRELKQMIVKGMGEFHINTMKWFLNNLYKIQVDLFAPKIPYRETITKSAEAMYRHKKQSGGAGQFGEVHMLIEPYYDGMPNQTKYPIRGTETHDLAWGGKLIFNNCIVGGAIDARFQPAILKGIMEKIEEGPLTGSYARDIVVNVFDGKMHPVDSNEMAFKLAGRNAFREAFKNAGPKILEPIYDVEVMVPADRMGDVMTDLQGRRAVVMGMDSDGNFQVIKAKVPLAEMNRYSTALSSITSGRGVYSMKFAEYTQVPTDVQTALLKAYEAEQKDEE
ncbi:MAG: elongation factor G [Bacteroidales bacterium]|jgi:elongation factor G|nr:elongation factor G [Bacteroidales bacterium]